MLLCPWRFSGQEYWSVLPCPPPGDLPNLGIEPRSPALQANSLPSETPIYQKYTENIIINSKTLKIFPLRLGATKSGYSHWHSLASALGENREKQKV